MSTRYHENCGDDDDNNDIDEDDDSDDGDDDDDEATLVIEFLTILLNRVAFLALHMTITTKLQV